MQYGLKRYIFTLLIAASGFYARAQSVKLYSSPRGIDVLNEYGDTLANPWSGGMVDPEPYKIDLDGDGRKDLIIFNAGGIDNRLHTYLNIGNAQYRYAPEYESYFPKLNHWVVLADYNGDGKEDIFTYSMLQAGMDVYKNVSTGNTPKFQMVAKQLEFPLDNFYSNIYTSSQDIPAIVDMDGDGDLDILAFESGENQIYYYKNISKDKYGTLDSLSYRLITLCWGKCSTTFDPKIPMALGIGCGADLGKTAHGASTLLAWDIDDDGDMDILYGNLFLNYISFLKNGRIDKVTGGFHRDSIISYTNSYPTLRPAMMDIFPGAFRADVDDDGSDDLLIAPQDAGTPLSPGKFFYYRNVSPTRLPDFRFVQNNYIFDGSISEGEHSAAAFFDYNGDGLKDLVIATKADTGYAYNFDKLELYKNIGNSGHAVYKKVDDDLAGVKSLSLSYTYLTFGDINGDGRQDLLLGSTDGNIYYFKNQGVNGQTVKFSLESSDLLGVNWGNYSAPCLADINKDGLLDLVVGGISGKFSFFKNTGSKTSPVFTLVTDYFGKARSNDYYYSYIYDGNGNIIDSTREMIPYGRSTPVITDINNDGKLDMISGSVYGNLIFYMDIEDHLSDSFPHTDTFLYNRLLGRAEQKSFGSMTTIAAADVNNDSIPELLIGSHMGGFYFYGSKEVFLGTKENVVNTIDFDLYPNPAGSVITLRLSQPQDKQMQVELLDVMGRSIYRADIPANSSRYAVDVSTYSKGIYMVRLQLPTGQSAIRKLIVE